MTLYFLNNIKAILIGLLMIAAIFAMNHYIKLRINKVVSDIRIEQEELVRDAISKADKFRKEIELLESIEIEKNKIIETQNKEEFDARLETLDTSDKTPASDFMKETIRNLQRGTK